MKSSTQKSTIRLLSIVLALLSSSPAALGYTRSTSPNNRPFVHPIGLEQIRQAPQQKISPTKKVVVTHSKAKMKRASYDLGIGKNPPVVHGQPSHSPPTNTYVNIEESTRFWVEYEATQEFPAPIVETPVPKVQPKRRTKDALHIQHPPVNNRRASTSGTSSSENGEKLLGSVPSMRRISNDQLDVNTAWVEMMLHSEQMKATSLISMPYPA